MTETAVFPVSSDREQLKPCSDHLRAGLVGWGSVCYYFLSSKVLVSIDFHVDAMEDLYRFLHKILYTTGRNTTSTRKS